MGYFLAILGAAASFLAAFTTASAFKQNGSDIQLILGGVYGLIATVCLVGAGLIFRMDEHHSKKDTRK